MSAAGTRADAPAGRGGDAHTGFWASLASLCASASTLVCCALPALLVALGAGAALSTLVSAVPQLVWLSEHKGALFGFAGAMLAASGAWQWSMRGAPCPLDARLRRACQRTRRRALALYAASVVVYATGGLFAFVLPWWNASA